MIENIYTFKASWPMIDITKITNELSYKNPMAVVRGHNSEIIIVIDDNIKVKSTLCNIGWPSCIQTLGYEHIILLNKSAANKIADIKSWISYVKKAKYPTKDKPVDITVEILSIA